MTVVFILCNGRGVRWGNASEGPKWAAEIGGQPNLFRTFDLLRVAGVDAGNVLCVAADAFAPLISGRCKQLSIGPTASIAETILNCAGLKSAGADITSDAVFLLGDVVYTPEALRTVLADTSPIRFFGRPWGSPRTAKYWGEIFAVRVRREFWPQFRSALSLAIAQCDGNGQTARLWDVSHVLSGDHNSISRRYFEIIDDDTDDYDTYDEYIRMACIHDVSRKNLIRSLRALWVPRFRYQVKRASRTIREALKLRELRKPNWVD